MEIDELLDELRKQYGPPIARMQELVELGDTATGWALTKIDEERSEIEAGLANAFAVLLFPE